MNERVKGHDEQGRVGRSASKNLPVKLVPAHCENRRTSRVVAAALALTSLMTNTWLVGNGRRRTLVTEFDAAASVGPTSPNWTTSAPRPDVALPTDRITFVCDISCEMGNMLGYLAYCAALALRMERDHGVGSELMLRHNGKEGGKWESSRDDILACFPRLSDANFSLSRTRAFKDEFELRRAEQERSGLHLTGINHRNLSKVEGVLRDVARRAKTGGIRSAANGSITLPFLAAKRMLPLGDGGFLDRYYDEIRALFAFDDSNGACCALKPDPDETVFHLRNFKTEVNPGTVERMGYKELGPKQTANDLLGHLHPGDKVAVVSRFSTGEVDRYLEAMRDRGLQVRLIAGQSGRQDFCFLRSAQKEMVGVSISTYFFWAARLSNARRIVTYSLNVPSLWSRRGQAFFQPNYTHPPLAGRYVFRFFTPDESDHAPRGITVSSRS